MRRTCAVLLASALVLPLAVAVAAGCVCARHAAPAPPPPPPPEAAPALRAACGRVDITPDPHDRPVWMAGFGNGRRARSVHDRLYARALVLSDGRRTVALVGVDVVGLFYNDVEAIRTAVAARAPLDYVLVAATHDHHGPDTMGLWGPLPLVTGVDALFMKDLRAKIAALVADLAGRLEPARIRFAMAAAPVREHVCDGRDPCVIDNNLAALQLARADGTPLGSLANWACHPETLDSGQTALTADYPGALCARLEETLGGTAVFLAADLGGMMTPDQRKDAQGHPLRTFAEAERIGRDIADTAAAALRRSAFRDRLPIRVAARPVLVPVTNRRYHLGLKTGQLARPLFTHAGAPFQQPATADNVPCVRTEVARLDLGPAQFITLPGELLPELAIGGYDGSYAFGHPLIAPDNPNPPDLTRAPAPPYLRDLMTGEFSFLVGLANDELGYIIPPYDFKRNDDSPIHDPEPPGDHYEETNSCGPDAAPVILRAAAALLKDGASEGAAEAAGGNDARPPGPGKDDR